MESSGLRSSLSDLLGRLPARPLPARRPDGAGPARGVQGRRAPGAPARERGAAPPHRPGPLPASRPAVARSIVEADPPPPVARGARRDPGDAARLGPAPGHPQTGLRQPAASRLPAILAEPRSRLAGIVTRDPAKAEPYGVRSWSDLDSALAASDATVVYVATPVFLHAPQTIAALRTGRHVLCEKPMAMNYAEALAM